MFQTILNIDWHISFSLCLFNEYTIHTTNKHMLPSNISKNKFKFQTAFQSIENSTVDLFVIFNHNRININETN